MWKSNLQHLLSSPDNVQDEAPHPSLPYDKLGKFIAKLHEIQANNIRYRHSISPAMALEFAILTCMQTSPVICA